MNGHILHTGTGNMVDVSTVAAPRHPRWFSGHLLVEPHNPGLACLLLVTPTKQFALRPATSKLTPTAWQVDGAFDATHSGIVRSDGRVVAPYADEKISVRGAVTATEGASCGGHPTLAFSAVSRKDLTTETSTGPPTTTPSQPSGAEGEVSPGLPPGTQRSWKSGTLIVVPGNQGQTGCLALDTDKGAYVLTSATNDLDMVTSFDVGSGYDPRTTGVHIHGRNTLGMASSLGQQTELLGGVMSGTDYECSGYPDFAVLDYR